MGTFMAEGLGWGACGRRVALSAGHRDPKRERADAGKPAPLAQECPRLALGLHAVRQCPSRGCVMTESILPIRLPFLRFAIPPMPYGIAFIPAVQSGT